MSIFEASGISKETVLGYTFPYIHAVYPKIMEQKLSAINPFGFIGGSGVAQEEVEKSESASDFFSGML